MVVILFHIDFNIPGGNMLVLISIKNKSVWLLHLPDVFTFFLTVNYIHVSLFISLNVYGEVKYYIYIYTYDVKFFFQIKILAEFDLKHGWNIFWIYVSYFWKPNLSNFYSNRETYVTYWGNHILSNEQGKCINFRY